MNAVVAGGRLASAPTSGHVHACQAIHPRPASRRTPPAATPRSTRDRRAMASENGPLVTWGAPKRTPPPPPPPPPAQPGRPAGGVGTGGAPQGPPRPASHSGHPGEAVAPLDSPT